MSPKIHWKSFQHICLDLVAICQHCLNLQTNEFWKLKLFMTFQRFVSSPFSKRKASQGPPIPSTKGHLLWSSHSMLRQRRYFLPILWKHHTMDQTIPSRCPKGFGSTLSEFHQLLWLRSRNTSLIRKNQENSQNLGKSAANAKTEDYYSIYMILHVFLYIHIMIKYGLSSTSDS